jgi:predicted dehydrogenase
LLTYGVVGYGYWGPNLVRSFYGAEGSTVAIVAERDAGRRALVAATYPGIEVVADAHDLIGRSNIDVVAVATPVSTHFPLACSALRAGKHVFLEKPMTSSVGHAEELIGIARRLGLQIFVDHTFVYTGAVKLIKAFIDKGDLGKFLYYDSVRINLGLFQHDMNVLWDLAVHDISILHYILPQYPNAVSAIAIDPVGDQPASIGYLTLYYPSAVVAHIHASWLAPVKVRQTLIGGDRRMIVYNDLDPSEKIRIYDKGIEFAQSADEEYRLRVGYRSGDMLAPQIDPTEALAVVARHANHCFANDECPITSGEFGLRVIKTLEAADQSAVQQGRVISL